MARIPCLYNLVAIVLATVLQVQRAAADVTIYNYQPVQGDQQTALLRSRSVIGFSQAGVTNGLTQYVVSEVQSLLVEEMPSTTTTIPSIPTTVTYTVELGASEIDGQNILTQSVGIPGQNVVIFEDITCKGAAALAPGGEVDCEQVLSVQGASISGGSPQTTTFKARLTPIYTLTAMPSATNRATKYTAHFAGVSVSIFILTYTCLAFLM